MDGARLAVDFLEVNPPLVFWLAMVPVAVGRITGISAHQVMLILLVLLSAGSLIVSERVLARLPNLPEVTRRAFILAATFAVFVLPLLDFSQREHLALVLTLPWICLAIVRASGGSISSAAAVGIGLAGAVGFSLKPHFLCAWLLVEAYLVHRTGWRTLYRMESIVLAGAGILYAAVVLLLTPDYLPMALTLRPLYSSYLNNGIEGTLFLGLHTPWPWFLFVALAHWHVDRRPDASRSVLAAATLGFFLGAVLQQKGLGYHFLAANGFGFLLLVAVVLRTAGGLLWYPSAVIVRLGWLLVPALVLSASASTLLEIRAPDRTAYNADPSLDLLVPVVRREAAGGRIMVLSSNPASAWPLTTEAGTEWSSRYMSLWPLAALYHDQLVADDHGPIVFQPLAKRVGPERQFHDAVIDDLDRYRPRLLVVLERNESVGGAGGAARLDYLAYFGEDPRFVQFFADYRDIGEVGLYRLYRRRDLLLK
jgi:hypothetical protein